MSFVIAVTCWLDKNQIGLSVFFTSKMEKQKTNQNFLQRVTVIYCSPSDTCPTILSLITYSTYITVFNKNIFFY